MGQKFFIGFLWKLAHNRILICRIQKLISIFETFFSSFLSQLVKKFLKDGSKHFFLDFHENCHTIIFPNFFIFIFIFPRLVKNGLKNETKFFFGRFSWKLPHKLILIWRIQKSDSFFHIFLSLFSAFSFLPRLVKNVL